MPKMKALFLRSWNQLGKVFKHFQVMISLMKAHHLIVMFLLVLTSASAISYHSFNECQVNGENCDDFKISGDEISFFFSVPEYYFRDSATMRITSVTLDGARSVYGIDPVLCKQVLISKDAGIASESISALASHEKIHVIATGCKIPENDWLEADIRVNIFSKSTNSLYGSIKKFMTSDDYEQKEHMNMMFFRFIPIIAILLLSAAGLVRVKR